MEATSYLQFIFALVFVLGLIAALAWVARRFGLAPRATLPRGGGKGDGAKAERRLAIVEVLAVDARRRMVLVRRDDTEHLVLIGAERDTVIETGISAPGAVPDTPKGGGAV